MLTMFSRSITFCRAIRDPVRDRVLVTGTALLFVACTTTGAVSSFRGMDTPVMLGPQQRVGVAGPAANGKTVDTWWAETVRHESSQDMPGERVTTIASADEAFMAGKASEYIRDNHKGSADLDMHVTDLDSVAYITSFGGAKKEYVRVEVNIVKKSEAK